MKRLGWTLLAAVLLLLVPAGCGVSDKMVELPLPQGLVPLEQLENHLDYRDPYADRSDYSSPERRSR